MPNSSALSFIFFFFNDTATTEIYTLSLHDALPISSVHPRQHARPQFAGAALSRPPMIGVRSEEHTSELQSLAYLVCRLLLEKKNSKEKSCYGKGMMRTTCRTLVHPTFDMLGVHHIY